MVDERVDEQTCVGGAKGLGDLEEGHGDGDELCVGSDSVVEDGAGEVFNIFYVCCSIEEVWPMSGALK